MNDARQRREVAWFFAIAFLVLAAGIGLRNPWPADEPRFVLALAGDGPLRHRHRN